MSNEKVYPKGIKVFKPHDNAPDFVKGKMIINIEEFREFINTNKDFLDEYKGKKQLKLDILAGRESLYVVVDTWKPENNNQDDFPF